MSRSLLFACGKLKDEQVRSDFLREHPAYEIVSSGVGEGDASAVYYHIKYKKPGDGRTYEDVWQYIKIGDSGWALTHKETLNLKQKE